MSVRTHFDRVIRHAANEIVASITHRTSAARSSSFSSKRKVRHAVMEAIEPRILFTALDGSEVVGLPSDMKTSLYTFIGDHSTSNSEKWDMAVGGHNFSASTYGAVQRDLTEYKKGETYDISVTHMGSNRYVNGVNTPDYDYRAWVDKSANPPWTSGATVASGPTYFVTETNNPALIQKRWFGSNSNNAAGKTAKLVIPGIDLDVDTANDDGFGTVTDNVAEDVDEFNSAKGKYIVADTGDADSDGVIDNADFNGVAGVSFVPVFLRLPANMQLTGASLANITLSFSYGAADLTANATDVMRLWTVDASSARGATEFLDNGEQVTAASLGMTFGGTTKLYMECVKGAASNRPLTVTATVAGTVWSGVVQDQVYFTPIKFNIKSLDFYGRNNNIYPISKDDGTVLYSDKHWLDNNLDGDADDTGDHKYPVAYKMGETMVIYRQFVTTAPPNFTLSNNLVVHGLATGGYDFWAQQGISGDSDLIVDYAPGTSNIFTTQDTASTAFPNWIDHFDPMTIKWSFSTDGGANFNSVGDTKNQVYTLLDAPSTNADGKLFHTVVHNATAGPVKGLASQAAVVSAIFQDFTDQDVRRVDGTRLVYNPGQLGDFASTPLSRPDGNGQCSSMADLFADMLLAHGISATKRLILPTAGYKGFVVNNGTVQGGGVLTFPNTAFAFHVVVETNLFSDRIFDPSFGAITDKSTMPNVEEQWEADHVPDLVLSNGTLLGGNPAGPQLQWSTW